MRRVETAQDIAAQAALLPGGHAGERSIENLAADILRRRAPRVLPDLDLGAKHGKSIDPAVLRAAGARDTTGCRACANWLGGRETVGVEPSQFGYGDRAEHSGFGRVHEDTGGKDRRRYKRNRMRL